MKKLTGLYKVETALENLKNEVETAKENLQERLDKYNEKSEKYIDSENGQNEECYLSDLENFFDDIENLEVPEVE